MTDPQENEPPEAYSHWADADVDDDPPEPTPAEHQLLATLRERGTHPERACDLIARADALEKVMGAAAQLVSAMDHRADAAARMEAARAELSRHFARIVEAGRPR